MIPSLVLDPHDHDRTIWYTWCIANLRAGNAQLFTTLYYPACGRELIIMTGGSVLHPDAIA